MEDDFLVCLTLSCLIRPVVPLCMGGGSHGTLFCCYALHFRLTCLLDWAPQDVLGNPIQGSQMVLQLGVPISGFGWLRVK